MYDVSGKSVVVVKHSYFDTPGLPSVELVRFLRGRASSILFIRHPFPDAAALPLNTTIIEYASDGKISREIKAPLIRGNPLLFYIKDIVFSLYYVITSGRKYDLYVGVDNLNCLAGLLLKILGRVKTVAYYVIDFTPVRFQNKVMNSIYQAVNKASCYYADVIWNVSETMIKGRESIGIKGVRSAPQITVPLGCSFETIKRKKISNIRPHDIVYFGALRKEHGPGLIIEALPAITVKVSDAKVVFIGDGPLKNHLAARAEELNVSSHVQFKGFIESVEDVYEILTLCGLALATYPPDDSTYKFYSDPGKVKIYLACGLPVLITDVPPIAKIIHDGGAGKIVEYSPSSLTETVIGIFADSGRYSRMREEAIIMASEFDWNAIWLRTFESMNV